ncbi:MAG TPA: PDZ domain-containing protein [Pyrinomonadaceae bacterium]|nr:PDZ domain-containing protein [Pyrinomonadaceae bacterium]
MFNRYLSSVMIITSAFTFVIGQTPEPKKEKTLAPQAFAFSFEDDGGYLGVQTVEVTKENFSKFGLRDVRGVAVEKVLENSPAAAAGLKDGDVIVRFNGDEVTSTRKLTRLIGEVEPDHQVKLTIARGGSEQEITATIAKRPGMKFGEGNFKLSGPGGLEKLDLEKLRDLPQLKDFPMLKDFPQLKDLPDSEGFRSFSLPGGGEGKVFAWSSSNSRQIGVGVTDLTKQLAQHFGVEDGLLISEVRDNSPAAKAGLKAGDIIIDANSKAVISQLDLIREVNSKKEGDVQLTIVRSGKRQTISVTPEASKDSGFLFDTKDGEGRILTPPAPRAPANPAAPKPMIFRSGRII